MKTKNLYKAMCDVKERGRWLKDWTAVRVVANGDLRKAINKAERVAKAQGNYEKARATSIERVSEVDAV